MVLRSSYEPYQAAVEGYLSEVMRVLRPLQALNGGPIIAFQIENEYMFEYSRTQDIAHFMFLYKVALVRGCTGEGVYW